MTVLFLIIVVRVTVRVLVISLLMGRGKIDIKRIENSSSRKVTFSKRRVGLVKKAQELAILCDAEIGLIIFSSAGKLFEFASSSMAEIIERYKRSTEEKKIEESNELNESEDGCQESRSLKKQVDILQSSCKRMSGEDITGLSLKELHQLEQQMSINLNRVKAQKDRLLLERLDVLNRKERQLEVENKTLRNQIKGIQSAIDRTSSDISNPSIPSPCARPITQTCFMDAAKSPITYLQLL